MSNQPKKIELQSRERVSAHKLRTQGERVTIKTSDTFLDIELGYLLNGKVYRAPGISDVASHKPTKEVIRDGGKLYDQNS